MNVEDFRQNGKELIDYICSYMTTIEKRDVAPRVDPGFLHDLIPESPPETGEKFKDMLDDVDKKIMPGMVHWNHPNFFAYFPSGNSFPSILGEMISSAIGSIGFSWASSPAATELEQVVLNWYAKALDLPEAFLYNQTSSRGGGCLQGSASECVLVCMMAARARAIEALKRQDTEERHESVYLPQLVAYASKEAHSCIEKAAKMALVKLRILDPDRTGALCGETLKAAIENDTNMGLTPFFVVATLGTTASCVFDNIQEIGTVCQQFKSIWFHVDGAYAGNSFILPEMRKFKVGLEFADSFNTNPNKLLLTNFDASAMWVKDVMSLTTALNVDPLYLQHDHNAIDFRHYGIPLSRRFRALKLWFVFRSYGIAGLQAYIRNHIRLAKRFENLVKQDKRFEVRNDVNLGLVCFRLKRSDPINRELLARINHSGRFHMTPAMVRGKYIIRFCVTYEHATEEHIDNAWEQIKAFAEQVLVDDKEHKKAPTPKPPTKVPQRFAFTRSVSREIYERQTSKQQLRDGCTPIVVPDNDWILKSLQKATKQNQKAAGMNVIDSDSTDDSSS